MPNPTNGAPASQTNPTQSTDPKVVGQADPKAAAPAQGAPQGAGNPTSDAAKEAMRKLKIKHDDGREEEVDEAEVLKIYRERKGHQRAANKELQDGRQARKQAEAFIEMMKDPERFYDAAKKLGHDPRKLAEKYLTSQIEEDMLDPREKELRDARAELRRRDEIEKKAKDEANQKRLAGLKKHFAEDYNKQFTAALQETGLPATKPMVAEMAKYIGRATEIGFKMTAKEAAQLVLEDIQTAQRNLYGSADGEALMKLIGEDMANKVRKWDTDRLKNPEAGLQTPPEQGEQRQRTRQTKRMSHEEWREYNRKK